jgi:hypothetical protein
MARMACCSMNILIPPDYDLSLPKRRNPTQKKDKRSPLVTGSSIFT